MYKSAKFEEAIHQYTKTLDKIPDKDSEIALKVYSNRAACYKQLSNFDGVISDCTSVLEVKVGKELPLDFSYAKHHPYTSTSSTHIA